MEAGCKMGGNWLERPAELLLSMKWQVVLCAHVQDWSKVTSRFPMLDKNQARPSVTHCLEHTDFQASPQFLG